MTQLAFDVPEIGSTDWGLVLNDILEEIKSSFNALESSAATTAMLAGKANTSMDNVTTAGKQGVVAWGLPNWSARVSIATNYTFSKKGWLLVWQYTLRNVTTNLNGVEILRTDGGHDYLGANHNNIFIPVDVGDKLTGSLSGAIFIPCKGV